MSLNSSGNGPSSKCEVVLKDNYVDITWYGRISKEMAAECNLKIFEAAKKLLSQHKPLLARFHTVDAPVRPNVDAFEMAIKIFDTDLPPIRLVIWGELPKMVEALIHIMIASFGRGQNIKYIKDEKAALAWLIEG